MIEREKLQRAIESAIAAGYQLNSEAFDFLNTIVATDDPSIIMNKALQKLEELEARKVKNVLQKMKALRGLAALAEALFKKGISVTVTWRIIFGTLIFVGSFTAMHFFIWAKRSKTMGEEKGLKDGGAIKEVPKPGAEEPEEEGG